MGNWHLAVVVWTVLVAVMTLTQAAWADAIGQIKTLAGDVSIVRNNAKLPAKAGDVRTVVIEGRVVMRDRRLLTLNEESIKSDARRYRERIVQSVGVKTVPEE